MLAGNHNQHGHHTKSTLCRYDVGLHFSIWVVWRLLIDWFVWAKSTRVPRTRNPRVRYDSYRRSTYVTKSTGWCQDSEKLTAVGFDFDWSNSHHGCEQEKFITHGDIRWKNRLQYCTGITKVNHVLSFLAVSSSCSNLSVSGIWFCCNESTSSITKHGIPNEIHQTIQADNSQMGPSPHPMVFYTKCLFDPRWTTHRLREALRSNLSELSKNPCVFKILMLFQSVEPTLEHVNLHNSIVSYTNNLSCWKSQLWYDAVVACRACTCSSQRSQAHLRNRWSYPT